MEEIIDWCKQEKENEEFIEFPVEILDSMSEKTARVLAEIFGKDTFMRLPEKEIEFFEWLREKDEEVWDDLWDTENEEPYVVGVGLLPTLLSKTRGFPICDLMERDNYFFTETQMQAEESKAMLDSAIERFKNKKALTTEQALVLEISQAPIDIWRFAYRHGLPLKRVKKAADILVEDGVLLHLKKAEHLANVIE